MKKCPHCNSTNMIKKNYYYVKVLRAFKRRYFCKACCKSYSSQTGAPTCYQKKPQLNQYLHKLLVQGNSLRGSARILECSKSTAERKFLWLIKYQNFSQDQALDKIYCKTIQIDEMESIEHTKLKPLTIPLCVSDRYQILGVTVGKIPAKGHLAEIAQKKYGLRENQRNKAVRDLFVEIKLKLANDPEKIITDGSLIYGRYVKEFFPHSVHEMVIARHHKEKKRERLHNVQYKKIFDPMFALNQRCAMLRSDIKRLTRRSWCTTEKVENLYHHLKLYLEFNNLNIKMN